METAILTTIYKQPIAHMLKAFMKSGGVEVFLFNENFSVIEGGIGIAGIQVRVKKEELKLAQELLKEFNEGNI